ncbi:lipoprotein [Beggiatoa sp. SS]|nr:lipoprotein [Beggiatoa sp. SS]
MSMRSVFQFVSYWNPAIETDAEGKAQIQFTVPDNLTGWRVLVMAVTPGDRMGLGDANFKVNQPIEIRPALPNQVTSGDRFQAGFTIMNRTDKLRDLNVILKATGPIMDEVVQHSDIIQALPYKRYTQWLPLQTTGSGTIYLTAIASDAEEKDALCLNHNESSAYCFSVESSSMFEVVAKSRLTGSNPPGTGSSTTTK